MVTWTVSEILKPFMKSKGRGMPGHSSEDSPVIVIEWSGIDMIKYHTWLRIPNGKVTKTQWEPEGQPFSASDKRQQWTDTKAWQTQDINNKMIRRRSTILERSVIYFTWGLKQVTRPQPHPNFRCEYIDALFARRTPYSSMHHLLENINRDIKRR